MDNFTIYITVVLFTAMICSIYGVVYVSKVIFNQRKLEDEIVETVRKAINKWNY